MPLHFVDDFDQMTWEGVEQCTVCNTRKLPEHDGVFRHPMEVGTVGSPDICQRCVTEAAESIGWVDAEKSKAQAELLDATLASLAELQEKRLQDLDAIASLTRLNVNLQEQIDDLNAPDESFEEMLTATDADGNQLELEA